MEQHQCQPLVPLPGWLSALMIVVLLTMPASVLAAEAFAGQRDLLQRQLQPLPGEELPKASGLVVARLGAQPGEPQLLLLGSSSRGGAALTPQSRFELGSVTKALVGSLLARMDAQQQLHLDDTVERWMPELAGTPAGRLTLRSLATHQSGLPRLPLSLRFLASMLRDPGDPYRRYSQADMLDWLRDWGGEAKPEFSYSNLGFALLGQVLERAGGQPLAALMAAHILRPAGADGAGLEPELAAAQVQGHDERGRPTPAWTIGAFAGAGALRADAQQMLALLDAARQRRAPFDAGAEREQARRNNSHGAVALGWMRTEKHGDRIVWHNGGTGGFRSYLGYSEVSGRGVLLMANGQLDLDSLGMHLINPAFALDPPAQAARSAPGGWIGAVIALLTLVGMAWRLWRPQSRMEQLLELLVGAALMALAWRMLSAAANPGLAYAAAAVALLLGLATLARLQRQPIWPAAMRRRLMALLNAAGGLLLVYWLW